MWWVTAKLMWFIQSCRIARIAGYKSLRWKPRRGMGGCWQMCVCVCVSVCVFSVCFDCFHQCICLRVAPMCAPACWITFQPRKLQDVGHSRPLKQTCRLREKLRSCGDFLALPRSVFLFEPPRPLWPRGASISILQLAPSIFTAGGKWP